ncbi:MAG TPA: hypothetical protein VM779_00355 [Thermoanaerobaculia bacterium]|nr:hypothetical protein [Thermoanaerobaculia bacterium]
MEQIHPTTGTNTPGVTTASEVCAHCGQPLGGNRGIEEFLAKVGVTPEMINDLKASMQNVDIEEYLNHAKEYLRTAGDKVKPGVEKAKTYTKEHPGKVAAGVAILAVGAGLLIGAINRER